MEYKLHFALAHNTLHADYVTVYNHCYIQITTNKMQRFLIYLFLQALRVFQAVPPPIIRSNLTVHTASGIVTQYCC